MRSRRRKKQKQNRKPRNLQPEYSSPGRRESPGARRSGSTPRMSYGSHGASQTLNSLVGWIVDAGNAEDNIDLYSSTLRKRARDLYAGGGSGQ